MGFLLFIAMVALYVGIVTSDGMPSLEQLENPRQNLATRIMSADGVVLDHFFIERRVSLSYDSIPKNFINALIATEDKKFWDHWGVHSGRVFNAFIKNLLPGNGREGASTITMQLARNLYLNFENSLNRKIREAVTAVQIERTYTKEEIIQLYANQVAFGRGAYGIQVASQVYFDKQPTNLTLSECALLVGMLKDPWARNPVSDFDRSLQRRNLVLKLMLDDGYISSSQYATAIEEPITVYSGDRIQAKMRSIFGIQTAPHFVEMIRQTLSHDDNMKQYDLYRDGLMIHTTLNTKIQKYANEAVEEHLNEFQAEFDAAWNWSRNSKLLSSLIAKAIKNRPEYKAGGPERRSQLERSLRSNVRFIDSVKNAATTIQCGLVVMDPATGAILAMVGASPKFMKENPDAKYSLNHAWQIRRQPGSSFKPFVYACALRNGMHPSSSVECGPFSYTLPSGEVWSPSGSCGGGGSRSLYSALAFSINTVAARLITRNTSPQEVIALARHMGIESPLRNVPALALGAGGEVSPLEMTSAFGTFVFNGMHSAPYAYSHIEDHLGTTLYDKKFNDNIEDALSKKVATQMVKMMQGVIDYGTASVIRRYFKGIDAGGKTGTTNDAADAWFVGFTPQLVCGVWVGFDDKRVTFDCVGAEGYGGRAAAPIWGRLMAKIYSDVSLPYTQKKFSMFGLEPREKEEIEKEDSMISTEIEGQMMEEGQAPPLNSPEPPQSDPSKQSPPKKPAPALPQLPKPKANKQTAAQIR